MLWVAWGYLTGFARYIFLFHSQVRLRFKLAAGLGEPWCRDGGIPQGCPLGMVFIVALYVPWCRHLESIISGLLVRMSLLVNVSFLALQSRFGKL